MKTVPHWVCGVCKKAVAPVGKKNTPTLSEKMAAHRKGCSPKAGFRIKQVPQGAKR